MMEEDEHYEGDESESLINDVMQSSRSQRYKGLNCNLVYVIFTCVIGTSFQFGYSTGVVNAPEEVIEKFINSSSVYQHNKPLSPSTVNLLWSVVVSIWCIGGIIGGFTGGMIADKIGRKKTMFLNNIPMIIGSLLLGLSYNAHSYEMLIAGRFVIGVACGVATAISSIYLSEVSPLSLRGAVGVLNQFTIVTAVIVSQVLGFDQILGSAERWPFLLGAQIVPAIIQLIMLPRCPESPRWLLLKQGCRDQSEQVLYWLRNTMSVEDDLQEMLKEHDSERHMAKVTIAELFKDISLRQPLIIAVVMMLSQQFSGVNAVIYYSTEIFKNVGMSLESAQYATLGVGVVNVAMTFVSAILMDRAGRRTLHLYGLAVMFIFADLLTVSFLWKEPWPWFSYMSIVASMGFIVGFAIGPGSIPWFFVTELFAQRSRAAASSVAVVVNWTANFAVGLLFPLMQKHLDKYSFVPFMVLLALSWIFTYFKVPETKNLTIEEITAQFRLPEDGSESYIDGYQRLSAHDTTRGSDM